MSREKVHMKTVHSAVKKYTCVKWPAVHDQNVSIREECGMEQDQRNLHVDQFVKVESEKGSLL